MIQEMEISKEDLFRKIDILKIKCFDTEEALKSAETRIQELNSCNDYANKEIERLHSIIKEAREYIKDIQNSMWYDDKEVLKTILEILDKENINV